MLTRVCAHLCACSPVCVLTRVLQPKAAVLSRRVRVEVHRHPPPTGGHALSHPRRAQALSLAPRLPRAPVPQPVAPTPLTPAAPAGHRQLAVNDGDDDAGVGVSGNEGAGTVCVGRVGVGVAEGLDVADRLLPDCPVQRLAADVHDVPVLRHV